ncbi:MAG: ABC transporter ATP-binding protein, partial [Clostridia bacterium]|nr:ABC transporter ATP-binding protein [Clostridia bacterium]
NTLGLLSPEDHEKIRAAMERVHAAELAEKDFTAISDGQRQRVLLARAICQEPEIIVLDEPTSFLDIRHKLELLSILRSMAKEKGITVIMSLHEIDLAQKISDKIMCVHGDVISHFGPPEEIFSSDIISGLYGIPEGTYNLTYGSVELPPPAGEPKTFVISGCGAGVPVYRRLLKENTPFYAGILFENDLELPIARALAADVVTVPAFTPISDEAYERALALMKTCTRVIVTDFPIAEGNARIAELIDAARSLGLPVEQL